MIEVSATKFEAYDGVCEMFKVEMFDACAAEIKIDAVCNVQLWDKIAPLIRQCLVDMKLEGDRDEKKPTQV